VCKTLTSYIFSLYLKAPQTWYNLFPSTSIILLVLFISSLLTFIPVVFFLFFYFLFYISVLWKVWLFFQNISLFFLDCFTLLKPEIPKFSNFFCRQVTKIPLKEVLVTFYMITNTSKFPTSFADHSRNGRRRAIGQMASTRGTHLAPFLLGIWHNGP